MREAIRGGRSRSARPFASPAIFCSLSRAPLKTPQAQVVPEALLKSTRALSNEPGNGAIHLTGFIQGAGINEICRDYHLNKYSSASGVVERARGNMVNDRQFRRRVEKRGAMLVKSKMEG